MGEWSVNWTGEEREAIKNMALEKQLSIGGLIRQAVRLYHSYDSRLKAGETCTWSDDERRAKEFAGSLHMRTAPMWCNFYAAGNGSLHFTRATADEMAGLVKENPRVACIEIYAKIGAGLTDIAPPPLTPPPGRK